MLRSVRSGDRHPHSSRTFKERLTATTVMAMAIASLLISAAWGDSNEKEEKGRKVKLTKSAAEARVNELIEQARNVEANGDNTRRNDLLNQAAEIAGTSNPSLNSLRGLVFHNNQWLRPEAISLDPKLQATVEQYRKLRDASPDTLQAWLELAQWCHSKGLASESRANLKRIVEANPENNPARQALGHRLIDGYWTSPEQIVRDIEMVRAASDRFQKWEAPIRKIGLRLANQSSSIREKALLELQKIDDPGSITALEVILGSMREPIALEAVDRIAYFSEREAAESLLRIAIESPWDSSRSRAINHLSKRDICEVVPRLIGMLETPVSSVWVMVADRNGNLLHRHVFKQQGIDRDFVRQLDSYLVELNRPTPSTFDRQASNGRSIREVAGRAVRSSLPASVEILQSAGNQAATLESLKDQHNARSAARNKQLQEILGQLTGQNPGPEAFDWMQWWYDYNEVEVYEKSLSYRNESNYKGIYSEFTPLPPPPPRICECFIAGTLVTTDAGLVPIETIRTGDKVLSRNTENGLLEFRPVIQPTVREKASTLKIKVGNELLQCSKGHPFWVVDQGWVKARDLLSGQRIATLDGSHVIDSIEAGGDHVLYNMIVEGNASYFVGKDRILCHDNTIQQQGSKTIANRLTR